jgi:protein TonB
MKTPTVAYGACELKEAAQKYWMLGFGISLLIHISILAGYSLTGVFRAGSADQWIIDPIRSIPVELNPTPHVPGVVPAEGMSRLPVHAGRGIPQPVPEVRGDPERTIASQDDLRALAEPGNGEIGERATGGIVYGPEVEEEPPPFVPTETLPGVAVRVTPVYPPLALRAGLEGKVLVNMWVDRTGKVRKTVVVKTDHEMFNDAALEAARRFVFTPATMNGNPVSVWVVVPFRFTIRGILE